MNKSIAFYPHNRVHSKIFVKIGRLLRDKYFYDISYVSEIGDIEGEIVFEFEKEIAKRWNDVDISYNNLSSLEKKYSDINLMRSIFSERRCNFFPKYFNDQRVPYEKQLRYLVACFEVFSEWLTNTNIKYVVSELLIGLPDSILYAVCKEKNVQYISIRSSKMMNGLITCSPEIDMPIGMTEIYKNFCKNGIPNHLYDLANDHLIGLQSKIDVPGYMEISRNNFSLLKAKHFIDFVSRFTIKKKSSEHISLMSSNLRKSVLWTLYRFNNIRETKSKEHKWFSTNLSLKEQYFVFPLQYEPEATTSVRAFPFSDQMSVIQQIAKALPLGVTLVVKEHLGNQGYRKAEFYRDLHYIPNVKLIHRETSVHGLITNSLGVITLSSRMGWEALALGKPVIALGVAFWTDFEKVQKPKSWLDLKDLIRGILDTANDDNAFTGDDNLRAYTAAYISLVKDGNFIVGSKDFFTDSNIEKISNILSQF